MGGGETITRPVLLAESTISEVTAALRDVGDQSRIGRARSLYTALWEQLDQGRAAAVAAGYSVAAYDALRATRPDDLFANKQSALPTKDGAAFVAHAVIGIPSTTTIEMDLSGLMIAKQCVNALRAATPELPWAQEAESQQALGDTALRTSWFKIFLIFAVLIGAVIAIVMVIKGQMDHPRR